MKLNNKGITLIELMISISLISIVILFLFRLLINIYFSDNNTDFNHQNQQNRAVIMRNIQQDFIERGLIKIVDNSSASVLSLQFAYKDSTTATLLVTNDSLSYENSTGIEKWNLEKENETTKYAINCVSYSTSLPGISGEFFWVQFNIPVVVNPQKKNILDDLEFFYIGKKIDLENLENDFPNKTTLGNYQNNQCG